MISGHFMLISCVLREQRVEKKPAFNPWYARKRGNSSAQGDEHQDLVNFSEALGLGKGASLPRRHFPRSNSVLILAKSPLSALISEDFVQKISEDFLLHMAN